MADEDCEWAGVRFTPLHHHDGRFFRGPGLFAFVRRYGPSERVLLYVDHADCLAASAGPGHCHWAEALRLGLNELHVNIAIQERLDRLQLKARVVRACSPLLNVLDQHGAPPNAELETMLAETLPHRTARRA